MQNSHFVTASSSHLDSISSGQNQVTSQNHVKSVLKLINSEDINYNDFSESDTISVAVRLNSTGNSTMQNMSTLATGSNSTAEEQTGDENPLMGYVLQIMVGLHLVVFVSGLVGNTLVCMSVYRNKSLRTVTNYFIVNLAVADFLVILICLPPTVYWDVYLTWSFGLASCKLVTYLQVSVCLFIFLYSDTFNLSVDLTWSMSTIVTLYREFAPFSTSTTRTRSAHKVARRTN